VTRSNASNAERRHNHDCDNDPFQPPIKHLFSLPDMARWRAFLIYGTLQTVWFAIVYGGCDRITARRTEFVRVHFPFEEDLPFVPDLIWAYSSIYLLFLATPFVVNSVERLKRLALALATATAIGGVFFLLIPAEPDFKIPQSLGYVPRVFRLSDWINLDFNQVPSLHVAFIAIYTEAFIRNSNTIGKLTLRMWPIVVAIAAVLTFQHHLVDVVSGYLLGMACSWIFIHRQLHSTGSTD